jgi:DNA-binding FadR family transcriptional regulator
VLQQRIAAGAYPVGAKLPSGRLLAEEFEVSPAVIREATERLRTKGMVRSRQGAGCTVISDSINEGFLMSLPGAPGSQALRHIYELRLDIEGGAAALAARWADDADIAGMRGILASLRKALKAPRRALEWDLGFHQAVALATHNPHYPQLLAYLSDQWRQSVQASRQHTLDIQRAEAGSRLLHQVHDEHVAVLEAIARREPTAARAAAQAHLHNACLRLGLDLMPPPQDQPVVASAALSAQDG